MGKFDKNFNSKSDLSKFNGHYPLLIFAPLCLEYLAGKILTPEEMVDQYLKNIKDLNDQMTKMKLNYGVQQFRYIVFKSKVCNFINEEQGARAWIKVHGGNDIPLPNEAYEEDEEQLL